MDVLIGTPHAEQVRMVAYLATPGEVRGWIFLVFMSLFPLGMGSFEDHSPKLS
jgi:hypothetical protein